MAERYVGVSGVSGEAQQARIVEIAKEAGFYDSGYKLYLGVKAMPWTQGEGRPDDHGELWYPTGEGLANAVRIARSFGTKEDNWRYPTEDFNTVPNVQFFMGDLARDSDASKQFVELVMSRTTEWVKYNESSRGDHDWRRSMAVQLDKFPWMDPSTDDFLRWLAESSVYPVVLQCFKGYMEMYQPYEIVRRLRSMGELASSLTILFDASHGKGTEMSPNDLRPFIGGIKESVLEDHVEVGVAGGLDGENVQYLLHRLLKEFGPLSWDAESKLHYPNGEQQGDFREDALTGYLQQSARLARTVGWELERGMLNHRD